MVEQADAVVIGMGPGGEEVAGRLAEAGLDVVGIEKELVGGECPYWGCVPSKMMIRAANLLAEARRIPGIAGQAAVSPDWGPVAARIRDEATDNWNDKVAVDRFESKGGRFVRGEGCLIGPGRVQVGGRVIEARRAVVLATGTAASIPPIPGLGDVPYWTNRHAIETAALPESLVVLGGGAIGVELSQVFARFGVRVTLVEALDRLLPLEEPEVGELIADVLRAEGVGVVTATAAANVAYQDGRFAVTLADGQNLTGERLLVATGRRANLRAIGLGNAGIDDTQRWVPVDDHLRVAPGVWAVGDLTGAGAFTHVAMYQAGIAVADILGQDAQPAEYRALPRVTFSDPEAGSVGLTAQAAQAEGMRVRVGISQLPSSARGWIHKSGNEGFIKLVADADRGVLVGATSVGPAGGEVLGLLTLAVHAQTPISVLRTMIYAYPTFHRAVEDALRDLQAE
ncbi:MAG TPA: NAD(P)/FAD-dependent oxidoreductase [Acidimicrobiales bacterium]|nr:NAD(P)/FAD-dependent oxidoreductase [Acidimicrobiales bacterium]